MGFSLAWAAVHGRTPEALMEALGLQPGAGSGRDRAYVGELPEGWALYVDKDFERGFGQALDRLVALGARTIACRQEDRVMYAEARAYEGAQEIWRIVRDSERDPWLHVEASGTPPAQYEAIRARYFADQEAEGGEDADVDLLYEIPLELARSICGFRPGETEEPELTAVAAPKAAAGGGFFARLFGRG